MPTGYANEGKRFEKKTGRWVKKDLEKAFDYDELDQESAALLISFFRFYPDYFCDLCRSENATYRLELPQRMMLRIDARYKDNYITGCRGLTKTYIKLLGKMVKGILYPGVKMRYNAPKQKQAAALATQAFHQIEKDYPIIASHWALRNDRSDLFKITTSYGSEFTMYAPRGDNCFETIAEEIGQEGSDAFDMEKYEQDILPTCRLVRMVNQVQDRTHINLQHSHISNACSKQNRAYSVHRDGVIKSMMFGEPYEGYAIDFSWVTALMGNLRDINYFKDRKKTMTQNAWLREMCAIYTGNEDNPMLTDEVLSKSKKVGVMEDKHSGNKDAIYIVSHDVSYVDSNKNAKCSDIVLKLTKFDSVHKRDKYRKQAVYVDNYAPPSTDYLQAERIYDMWWRYSMDGSKTTYIVVDAQAYGTGVLEELVKPRKDGRPSLSCINGAFANISSPNALPVIYPLKAGGRGVADSDGDMISYAQREFEQGNVELLITNVLDGVEQYKDFHGIKDNIADGKFALPYKNTELLCQQIENLRTKVSGTSLKEERKSKYIQRDIWSALKYALRMAQKLEEELTSETYRKKSSWSALIEESKTTSIQSNMMPKGARASIIAKSRR